MYPKGTVLVAIATHKNPKYEEGCESNFRYRILEGNFYVSIDKNFKTHGGMYKQKPDTFKDDAYWKWVVIGGMGDYVPYEKRIV